MNRLIAFLISVALAGPAFAANMGTCQAATPTRGYALKPKQSCYLLCPGIGTTSGTTCGASTIPFVSDKRYMNMKVAICKMPANCDPGTISIDWCATTDCATPQTFPTALTATTTSFGEKEVPAATYQARFSTIGDSDCDASTKVDICILIDVDD